MPRCRCGTIRVFTEPAVLCADCKVEMCRSCANKWHQEYVCKLCRKARQRKHTRRFVKKDTDPVLA